MKGYWLGQAGFLFRTEKGTTVMVDPYMSDSAERSAGARCRRQVPVDESFFIAPDVLILSNDHIDHMDFDTIDRLVDADKDKKINMLLPKSALAPVRARYEGRAEFILFTPGTEVSLADVLFVSVPAAHSDPEAIGVMIKADGKTVYHTGDTLYNRNIFGCIDMPVDLLVTVINGKGNNMNAADAARFTKRIAPKAVLPMHWDMFPGFAADPAEFTVLFSESCGIRIVMPEHYIPFEI